MNDPKLWPMRFASSAPLSMPLESPSYSIWVLLPASQCRALLKVNFTWLVSRVHRARELQHHLILPWPHSTHQELGPAKPPPRISYSSQSGPLSFCEWQWWFGGSPVPRSNVSLNAFPLLLAPFWWYHSTLFCQGFVLGHVFYCFVVGFIFALLILLLCLCLQLRDSHKVYCHCCHLPRILISLISYITDLENKVIFLLYRLYLISLSMRQLRNNKSSEDNKNLNKTYSAPVPEKTVS